MLFHACRIVTTSLCLLFFANAASIGQTLEAAPAVRVGASLNDYSTPLLYADQAGLFQKAGLHVEIVVLNGGDAVAAAVAGGSLEIGKSNTLALIAAHAKGIPFTIIAPASDAAISSPVSAIIVPSASPIRSARDFSGKTVGVVGLVSIDILGMKAWIDKNGGDSQAVHFLEVRSPAVAALLEQGRIDAAPIFEPFLSQALSTGKFRIVANTYAAIARRVEDSDYFTTEDWAAKHRDVASRFARVMHDANVYVSAHESAVVPIIASSLKIDAGTLAHMHHPGRPSYVEASEIQALIDLAAKYGVIPGAFPAQQFISDLALKRP